MLPKARHDLLGYELHRLPFPRLVRSEPIDALHEQRAKRPDLLAERHKLVEQCPGRAVEGAAIDDGLDGRFLVGHMGRGFMIANWPTPWRTVRT